MSTSVPTSRSLSTLASNSTVPASIRSAWSSLRWAASGSLLQSILASRRRCGSGYRWRSTPRRASLTSTPGMYSTVT